MRVSNLAYGVAFVLLWGAHPLVAAEKLFDIIKLDGTTVEVTDDDLKQIGEITFTTPLVGSKDGDHQVTGPRFRDVLDHFKLQGTIADVSAIDNYRIDVPVEDARNYDVILATQIDGQKLRVRDRGPVWVIYPLKDNPELATPIFEARSAWQVATIRMK